MMNLFLNKWAFCNFLWTSFLLFAARSRQHWKVICLQWSSLFVVKRKQVLLQQSLNLCYDSSNQPSLRRRSHTANVYCQYDYHDCYIVVCQRFCVYISGRFCYYVYTLTAWFTKASSRFQVWVGNKIYTYISFSSLSPASLYSVS